MHKDLFLPNRPIYYILFISKCLVTFHSPLSTIFPWYEKGNRRTYSDGLMYRPTGCPIFGRNTLNRHCSKSRPSETKSCCAACFIFWHTKRSNFVTRWRNSHVNTITTFWAITIQSIAAKDGTPGVCFFSLQCSVVQVSGFSILKYWWWILKTT